MATRLRHPLLAAVVALGVTLPWLALWIGGATAVLSTLTSVGLAGLAILGAAFLLAWGAETAEKDVPRSFAIAILAVLAVAPEYAVDAYYAWEAGLHPEDPEAANLAIANMTGANRILIGLGWSGIALFSIYRVTRARGVPRERGVINREGWLADEVQLDRGIATEICFLTAATLYAFLIPISGGIDAIDMIVLVGLYVCYIAIVIRGEPGSHETHVGVPAYFQSFGKRIRVPIVLGLFGYSGFLILIAVEPFAHGLETLGTEIGVPPFFMIQWFAPLASESPELIVTAYLVNKARQTAAFNALISSKLNQWTLLVGTLVVVYSIALGHYGILPFDRTQAGEIWLTAAQSLFAVGVLLNFRISVREALTLLVLFTSQVGLEFVLIQTAPGVDTFWLLIAYAVVYLLLGGYLFATRLEEFQTIVRLTVDDIRGKKPTPTEHLDD